MDETPLPEYLIDMLKKAGHIDEDGKPIDDPFDPFDEEEVEGTKSERLRQMKEQEVGRRDVQRVVVLNSLHPDREEAIIADACQPQVSRRTLFILTAKPVLHLRGLNGLGRGKVLPEFIV